MEAQPIPRQKMSGLAITAFVLSLVFFLPVVPLVGAILGIVALATHKPDRGGKGLAIAAIPVGLVMVFFFQGLIAAVSIPAFIKYTRKAKTVEATESLDKMVVGARSYAQAEHYDTSGNLQPKSFPVARTDWVPRTPCCEHATHKCMPTEAEWNVEPWRSLHFQLADPHHFQYRYTSDGKSATIEARGDLDCDGAFSSFKMLGSVEENMFRGPIVENETE
jgi:hypothetical protein